MLQVIPTLEVIKSIADDNIQSSPSKVRRQAFEKANDLISITGGTIRLEGISFDKVKPKLTDDQAKTFEYLYAIDYTGLGVSNSDITRIINFIAAREAKPDWVIVLTENTDRHIPNDGNKKIVAINPTDFLAKMTKFKTLYNSFLDYERQNPHAKEFKTRTIESMVIDIFFNDRPA